MLLSATIVFFPLVSIGGIEISIKSAIQSVYSGYGSSGAATGLALSQLLGGRNYKKTVDIFFEAVLDGDGKEILKTLPDEMIEYLMEEEGFDSREEAEEELEDSIGNPKELLDNAYGDDWTYKYEIVNAEEYSSDELETLKETYQEEIPDIKIKDAKKVTLKLTIEAEEIGEQSNTIDLSVIKIGKN